MEMTQQTIRTCNDTIKDTTLHDTVTLQGIVMLQLHYQTTTTYDDRSYQFYMSDWCLKSCDTW